MIEIDGFGKCYGAQLAVSDLQLRVAAGEVLGLVGPNGAGKTTTLRALTGIIPASCGRLCVDGLDVGQQPEQVKARTAYVADDPQLFSELSVVQHLAFAASVYRVQDWQPRGDDLLDRFELTAKKRAAAGDLSRGMRQKLALCCALLHRPRALLLDEPMTGLDPQAIRTLKQSIAEAADDGAAVIISSHLLAVIEEVCSHVAILDAGRRRFAGTIDELRRQHAANGSLEDIFFRAVAAGETA